jgi:hypothetical protein
VYNIIFYWHKMLDEDMVSTYFWIVMYVVANLLIFQNTYAKFNVAIEDIENSLYDGTIDQYCTTSVCLFNRKLVRNGPTSRWVPLAKACGNALNFNCSLILLPVTRSFLRRINNIGISYGEEGAIGIKLAERPPGVFGILMNMFCGAVFNHSWADAYKSGQSHVLCIWTRLSPSNGAGGVGGRRSHQSAPVAAAAPPPREALM